MSRLWRVVRRIALAGLALVVVLLVLVCGQQRLLRWRAERLLADFQGIRLHESNWADMQRLMTRWGAWGRYEGSCTAGDCVYHVHLQDSGSRARWPFGDGMEPLLRGEWMMRLYERLGGRLAWMDVWVRVQDGTIRRKAIEVVADVPPGFTTPDAIGGALVVRAVSRPFLESWVDNAEPGHSSMAAERIMDHPDYEVRSPSGCTSCLMAIVTFTPQLNDAELRRVTAFDLSCMTRWRPCQWLEELDPAATEWNLYGDPWAPPVSAEKLKALNDAREKMLAEPCRLPAWARARDADRVVTADAMESAVETLSDGDVIETKLRVVSTQKGKSGWPEGATIIVHRPIGPHAEPGWQGEAMTVGHRYVLMPDPSDPVDKILTVGRCGVMETGAETMQEVARGIALNDPMRGGEKWPAMQAWWTME